MELGKIGAVATGQLMLLLGMIMVMIIGKGDFAVIAAGLLIVFGGIYILSLVKPSTRQFMGPGWPEKFCRISAVIAGLLMVFSGLISSTGSIKDIYIFHDNSGLNILLVGLLLLCWGLYILKLAISGVKP